MGVLGELFPGPKIRKENEESGTGEKWQLGPIDLDSNTVVLHRGGDATQGGFEAVEGVDADGDAD
ncbi:hypothetical protein ACFQ34_09540 [Pseudonocardia benzenivorans]|uniref:Uncharacterized protein n=2 Tax=Pseudonocardia TaxID=1847 RepID=F4CUX1_PSEUX|nr:hypothetical protein [Pseudonocardia dioxanivorans]AEA27440.1 hypothetical protein Psed_5306 [Pseudonocardia dioxanivorans CB1190]